jgi:acetolactate synthase-1/2/3 large subunit
MNGAESLVETLLAGGIDTCFANPGTSDLQFVAALDRIPGMRCVLGLQENVVTGAADGYWRMTQRPAATLLHCGPGLANGLANLHNAYRAHSGIVNIVGDQATYHRALDAPLTADTSGWARSVSGFLRICAHAGRVGADAAAAIAAARSGNGRIATLILPADTAWDEGGLVGAKISPRAPSQVSAEIIKEVAAVLRLGEPTMLILGSAALREAPCRAAYEIAVATGAKLLAQTSNGRIERGAGRVALERVPYPIDLALAALASLKHVILVGADKPVAFFAYPGKPNELVPSGCDVHVLATPEEDVVAALEGLHAELHAPAVALPPVARPSPAVGAINAEAFALSLAALLPEAAIVVDESITFGRSLFRFTNGAAPHDWLQLTGGAIGGGMPMAVGAAIGMPGRRVVSLQADGSALYTLQALGRRRVKSLM